jgi:pimeloyl-ACP methyl ester carboxylesterase
MGIQPQDPFIYDQFIGNTEGYARHGFVDQAKFDAIYGKEPDFDQLESWETDREMTSRLAWKPYMYNPALPRLLAGVSRPALVIWGDSDAIVPLECAERFRAALPDATLEVFPGSGHALDLEEPRGLAETIMAFSKARSSA